ncbi:hypothetical protein WICPIJ_009235 [Wickerhamomyces pijperi]|uniref:Phytanoyl-CoA dioxygenase n=1 Tax=Wickerhamomyces pijperi TaxID=599730 RepID=A0A9P8PPB1_WICPI|nr:hypothetical protein WICPIJ_009235 [Wickerhamomyces pijperi]
MSSSPFQFTDEQAQQYLEQGCLLIPDYLSSTEVSELLQETYKLIDEFDISTHPLTKFTTENDGEHVGDDYFLQSSDNISFFLEPGAFDSNNKLIKPKEKAVNKIGHNLLHNPVFFKETINEKAQQIVNKLNYKDPRVLQSMIICKQPEIGGEVPSHQDGVFLFTKPQTAMGFWIALEDCDENNGCLSYLPKSHLNSPITKRFIKKEDGKGTEFMRLDPKESTPDYSKADEDYKLLCCKKGSLILINHSVVHRSNLNLSNRSRYAYAFHVIDGVAEYDEKNWLQIPYTGGSQFQKLDLKI